MDQPCIDFIGGGSGVAPHCGAIGEKRRRQRIAIRAGNVSGRRPHQNALAPCAEHVGKSVAGDFGDARFGKATVELRCDPERVAVDVRADLQDGRAPIPAGKRHERWLRQDHRDDDGLPREVLETENQPNLLGVRRLVVVMQDHVHRSLPAGSTWRGWFRPSCAAPPACPPTGIP